MQHKTRKNLSMVVLFTAFVLGANAFAVTVPAGSVDGLADAIAEAGPGGEVVLAAGIHQITSTVLVDIPVSIVGEEGAVLESATPMVEDGPTIIEAALHIKGADGASVRNLTIQAPAGATANTGILIESSADVKVMDNQIIAHQQGILIQRGDRALVKSNAIQIVSDPEYVGVVENGIVVINGKNVNVKDNWVSGATIGIWLSDENGDASGNTTQGNALGFVLCHPRGFVISGELVSADFSATGWTVYQNNSVGNMWGYLVVDGCSKNILTNNSAALNSMYDMELTGDTMRFGFLAPKSYDNIVVQGLNYKGLKIKDCGENNRIYGHVNRVDTDVDSCY